VVKTVPIVALPPTTPLTLQVTFWLVVPVTLAVNCWLPLVDTVAIAGLTATATMIVTEAEADLVGSATLVATTVTVAGEGTADGAV